MFDKLFQAQQMADDIKKRLDTITVSSDIENGAIRVEASGNKQIRSIKIDPQFFADTDHEALEELLAVAVNKAIEQAEQISQSEMQAATKDMLGGFGNIFGNTTE